MFGDRGLDAQQAEPGDQAPGHPAVGLQDASSRLGGNHGVGDIAVVEDTPAPCRSMHDVDAGSRAALPDLGG